MENSDAIVSICCITYNQEKYIKDTIEGFLSQNTSFPIEIIIHDDCSTDNTKHIISEYCSRYPDLIKPIFQKENQYSQGKKIFPIVFSEAVGKYIAICEGDDYWTDSNKLQRQFEFLENNSSYVMATENSIFLDLKNNTNRKFSNLPERDIDIFELLMERQFATASVLFRNLGDRLKYGGEASGDTILWCHLTKFGKIRYLENVSSVYRRHDEGVTGGDLVQWSKKMVAWNRTLSGNHPEIDPSLFYKRNLEQFKISISSFLNGNKFKEALVAIDELVSVTDQPGMYRNDLYCFFENKIIDRFNSWTFRLGKILILPFKVFLKLNRTVLELIRKGEGLRFFL